MSFGWFWRLDGFVGGWRCRWRCRPTFSWHSHPWYTISYGPWYCLRCRRQFEPRSLSGYLGCLAPISSQTPHLLTLLSANFASFWCCLPGFGGTGSCGPSSFAWLARHVSARSLCRIALERAWRVSSERAYQILYELLDPKYIAFPIPDPHQGLLTISCGHLTNPRSVWWSRRCRGAFTSDSQAPTSSARQFWQEFYSYSPLRRSWIAWTCRSRDFRHRAWLRTTFGAPFHHNSA